MSRVTFKREAKADIDETALYIAEDAGDLTPAFRFIETINDTANLLATQLENGPDALPLPLNPSSRGERPHELSPASHERG